MGGTIRFDYDKANDLYVVVPKWNIETDEDCKAWHQQYVDFLGKLNKRVDMILILDDFRIGAKVGPVWGKYRADIINRFTRFSVRVHADAKVATFVATSAALHDSVADEARDVPTAVQLILEKRRRAR
jgi:hypothetical protein